MNSGKEKIKKGTFLFFLPVNDRKIETSPFFRAFTLLEVLISSSIFLVILVTIYSAFQTGVFGYRKIEDRIALFQGARVILERMNTDLRNSFFYSSLESKFMGGKSEMSFLALVDTFSQGAMEKEYSYVSYKADASRLTRLCRRNKESLNEKSLSQPDEMTDGLEELGFEYGYIDPADKLMKFKESWGTKSDPESESKIIPVAVRIKLILKKSGIQDFQRTVYLPMAKNE